MQPGPQPCASYLDKRSGGWTGRSTRRIHWQTRYFVLQGTPPVLQYWKTSADFEAGAPALGGLCLDGARMMVEPPEAQHAREEWFAFSLLTPQRELRMRARPPSLFSDVWQAALQAAMAPVQSGAGTSGSYDDGGGWRIAATPGATNPPAAAWDREEGDGEEDEDGGANGPAAADELGAGVDGDTAGWLLKRAGTSKGASMRSARWQLRYFVLRADETCISYFKTAAEAQVHGPRAPASLAARAHASRCRAVGRATAWRDRLPRRARAPARAVRQVLPARRAHADARARPTRVHRGRAAPLAECAPTRSLLDRVVLGL